MLKKWGVRLIAVFGVLLLAYPLISNFMQQRYQNDAVATYQEEISRKDEAELEREYDDAVEYNDMLFQTNGAVVDNMDLGILSDEHYMELLNLSNGIMGSIEIPKINVSLPIYHGTSEEVLSTGIGHWQGTSLPVGGDNTRCVLTGHRGLPGSKLFTRLDEMDEGDLFFIRVLDKTLAYKVCDIQTILPDELEALQIDQGRDLASLVTCTPYGINTHRLVVTGVRVAYEETEYESIHSAMPSVRELVFTVLPFAVLGVILIMKIIEWRKNRYV